MSEKRSKKKGRRAAAKSACEADSSSTKSKYSIIIPTYNERENLPLLTQMIDDVLTAEGIDYEIVVVEDNSPDGTYEVACRLQQLFGEEKIRILGRKGKLGLGSAYVDGLKHCRGDFVLLMDADFSHHPKYIPAFIAAQRRDDADVVSGTRYTAEGSGPLKSGVSGWGFKRKLVSRGANNLAKVLLGISQTTAGASDLTGSFRLYKRKVLEDIMADMVSTGYVFQMEIMVRAQHLGLRIAQVPIVFVDRLFGDSKLGATEIGKYLLGILTLMRAF